MEQKWTASNPVTGDLILSRPSSEQYADGHDRIFGKSQEVRKAFKTQCESLYYDGWRVDRWSDKWVDSFGETVSSDGYIIVYLTNGSKHPSYETFAYVKV